MDPDALAALRREYGIGTLREQDAASAPHLQFASWLDDAVRAALPEPNAMVVSTTDPEGQPSSRSVLLKGFDETGFIFYTNLHSRKAVELAGNPRCSLLFPWYTLHRQVIIRGSAIKLSTDEDARYFASRPRGSQIGAWASDQSAVIPDRAWLDKRAAEREAEWPEGTPIPLPDFWGGYRVEPLTVEFWQGRVNRLHDRLRYRRDGENAGDWVLERLSP